jgi:hypothetical protein
MQENGAIKGGKEGGKKGDREEEGIGVGQAVASLSHPRPSLLKLSRS